MKRLVFPCVIFFMASFICFASFAQTVPIDQMSKIEQTAKKRTMLMKEQLFLSFDQTSQVMDITVEMLKKVNNLDKQKLEKTERKKQLEKIEMMAKNKIVSILTPAQRQRFESALFTKLYQTTIDTNKAVSKK